MASIGHVAVGMAAARVYRRGQPVRWSLARSMAIWSFLSLLPDADVLGFHYGIRFADTWGHRGATHSFAFAIFLAVAVALVAAVFRLGAWRTGLVAIFVVTSHAVLDTFTNGGLGCALLWPFDNHRYFAPWNPIPVAPIGRRFFSHAGLSVALAELALFAPLFLYAVWPRRRALPDGERNHQDGAA